MAGKPRSNAEQVVDGLLEIVDAHVPKDRRASLAEACELAGGASAIAEPRGARALAAAVYRVLLASPESSFC